jgi:hypothetical protein
MLAQSDSIKRRALYCSLDVIIFLCCKHSCLIAKIKKQRKAFTGRIESRVRAYLFAMVEAANVIPLGQTKSDRINRIITTFGCFYIELFSK